MKITFRKSGPVIYIHIILTTPCAAPVYLCFRNGNKLERALIEVTDFTTGEMQFTLLVSKLSATHFLEIITPRRTYHRFIPMKFLNLSAEHE